jgi:uncharacterized protein YutE (UPF0331/DUF86 family)
MLPVIDRDRVLVKLDELEGYMRELSTVLPGSFDEFRAVEKKRACERILQIAVECVIDVCSLLVRGRRLGIPGEEDDLFEKLAAAGIVSEELKTTLKRMKGFRNILVHEYGVVNDEIVYRTARTGPADFARFKKEVLAAIASEK